jgi:hypothetical protein
MRTHDEASDNFVEPAPLVGTNRMFGLVTASQIASASVVLFF